MSVSPVIQELAQAIDAKGSRAAFASGCGISDNYLSMILCGHRPFERLPVKTARKISEHSGISLDRLAASAALSE